VKAVIALALLPLALSDQSANAEGDSSRGARAFRACAACHSVEADRNLTGPSLANVLNRNAGSLPSFSRYSEPMKNSGVKWNEDSLDSFLKNPAEFMPGNHMTFPGIPDGDARADIIAYLKNGAPSGSRQAQGGMGGMMGMQRGAPQLKTVAPSGRVKSITYCRDTFKVTTADGKTRDFWERNLRFKTDSSNEGPAKDAPAIVGAGMMGDRASVIFAEPEEIGRFINRQC
jgi:cytochrome c